MVRHFMKQIISYFKIKVNVFGSKDRGSINNRLSIELQQYFPSNNDGKAERVVYPVVLCGGSHPGPGHRHQDGVEAHARSRGWLSD